MGENMKMSYEEERNYFNKYSKETLEFIGTLYDISDMEEPLSYSVIYKKKCREIKTDIEIDNSFNSKEIIDTLEELSKKELSLISNLIKNTINDIDPKEDEFKIMPQLIEIYKAIDKEKIKFITPIIDDMYLSDIESFFDKYNTEELRLFDTIFEYYKIPELIQIESIKERSSKRKERKNIEINNNIKPTLKLSDMKRKHSLLTNRELNFLHTLVNNAKVYLDDIQGYNDDEYTILEINALLESIEKEQTSREKVKTFKKTI